MNTVGIIMARLGLDTRDFKAGLAQATNISGKFSAQMLGLPNLGGVLGGAGLGIATQQILESAKHVQYLSERFGVSTTVIQQWGHAAEEGGSSLEAMTMGFNRLDVGRSKALAGDEAMLKHFHSLGITVSDLRTLAPDELMKRIGTSSMNAADMVAILGRNGTELRPILEGITNGTLKFGAAIGEIDVKKLAEAEEIFKRLYQQTLVFAGGKLAGIIGQVSDAKSLATNIGDAFKNVFTGKFSEAGKSATKALGAELSSLRDLVKTTMSPGLADAIFGKLPESLSGAPPPGKKPGTFSGDEQNELDAKVRKAAAMLDVLRFQLSGQNYIAEALRTHLEFQEKINAAVDANLPKLAEQLRLEERLTLQKQAQAIDTKRLESVQLSLRELAEKGEEFSTQGTLGPGHYAREAMAELEMAKQLMLRGGFGDVQEALSHKDRAEAIKIDMPELRESEKDRNSIDSSTKIEQLVTSVGNIEQNQIVVVGD